MELNCFRSGARALSSDIAKPVWEETQKPLGHRHPHNIRPPTEAMGQSCGTWRAQNKSGKLFGKLGCLAIWVFGPMKGWRTKS